MSPLPQTQPPAYSEGPEREWTPYPDPSCWVEDRTIVFRAEDNTFHFSVVWLSRHSSAVRDIMEARASDATMGTNANPIFVDGIKANEMASFIRWLSYASSPGDIDMEVANEAYLLGVLAVSRLWGVQMGEAFVLKNLDNLRPSLSSSRQLELAR
ncbi:hypothetical protein P691DRAFT_766568 [Macrolepiota fuliginosa MF-IS2]|uniref:BTB domain-containing protein n=1 Tax=Macrolepiota fuliginosa MF-IS2 TaxID=1400762 RepID=A0A9P5WZ67_9AGAR|nr:hypothetical protein P691DRAFT_766568 [Macrolepiota fuliginosa MF-IS2]